MNDTSEDIATEKGKNKEKNRIYIAKPEKRLCCERKQILEKRAEKYWGCAAKNRE